jgi:hypothetical protein
MAHTRNGSELVYNKFRLLELMEFRSFYEKVTSAYDFLCSDCQSYNKCMRPNNCKGIWRARKNLTLHDLIKNRLFGLIQSRLFQGNFNLENYEQDFRLTFKHKSWCHYNKKFNRFNKVNVFTSSSFACQALLSALKNVKSKGKWTGSANLFESTTYKGKGTLNEKERVIKEKAEFRGIKRVKTFNKAAWEIWRQKHSGNSKPFRRNYRTYHRLTGWGYNENRNLFLLLCSFVILRLSEILLDIIWWLTVKFFTWWLIDLGAIVWYPLYWSAKISLWLLSNLQ